jgi:hypothetical protein
MAALDREVAETVAEIERQEDGGRSEVLAETMAELLVAVENLQGDLAAIRQAQEPFRSRHEPRRSIDSARPG